MKTLLLIGMLLGAEESWRSASATATATATIVNPVQVETTADGGTEVLAPTQVQVVQTDAGTTIVTE